MHAVVNILHFSDPIEPALFAAAERDLRQQMQMIQGFAGLRVVQTADTEAILLILADSAETLDRLATEVGSPWMRANVVPLLAGPPERHLGPIIATIDNQ
jgi:hypothetical protein